MMFRPGSRHRERGAALLIVLLLVATLSVIALAIVQTVSMAYRTSGLSAARSQIMWFALGAEDIASQRLSAALKLTEGRFSHFTPGLGEPLSFSVPDGKVTAIFNDHTNCFNLNSLAQQQTSDDSEAELDPAQFYKSLLVALDFNPGLADELVASVQDWIDDDNQPRQSGAETTFYASLEEPYAAGNTFLVTPNELLSMRRYDGEIFRRIRPYVCTRPDSGLGPFNINTLQPSDAALLVPVFSEEVSIDVIRTELESLQTTELTDDEDFFARPAFSLVAPEQRLSELIDIKSDYFRLSGDVVYLDSVTSYEAVFARGNGDDVVLLRRRLGVDE